MNKASKQDKINILFAVIKQKDAVIKEADRIIKGLQYLYKNSVRINKKNAEYYKSIIRSLEASSAVDNPLEDK